MDVQKIGKLKIISLVVFYRENNNLQALMNDANDIT